MREILFRGKRVYGGEWMEGLLVKAKWWADESCMDVIIPVDTMFRFNCEVDEWEPVQPDTVGQFTGLCDKNGKKIFEGDIVRMNGNLMDIAVIRFGKFECVDIELEEKTDLVHGWHVKPLVMDSLSLFEPFCWEFQLNEKWIKKTKMEVIGNTHDDLELLEG